MQLLDCCEVQDCCLSLAVSSFPGLGQLALFCVCVMDSLSIFPLASRHVAGTTELCNSCLKFQYSVSFFLQFLYSPKTVCLVAVNSDHQIIGAIAGKLEESQPGVFTGHIYILAVQSEYRRKGLGRTLLNQITENFYSSCTSCSTKLSSITLEMECKNHTASQFYRCLGFSDSGQDISRHGQVFLQKILV